MDSTSLKRVRREYPFLIPRNEDATLRDETTPLFPPRDPIDIMPVKIKNKKSNIKRVRKVTSMCLRRRSGDVSLRDVNLHELVLEITFNTKSTVFYNCDTIRCAVHPENNEKENLNSLNTFLYHDVDKFYTGVLCSDCMLILYFLLDATCYQMYFSPIKDCLCSNEPE